MSAAAADGLRLASMAVDGWYKMELSSRASSQPIHSVLVGFAV
jgi:hypothetical protein